MTFVWLEKTFLEWKWSRKLSDKHLSFCIPAPSKGCLTWFLKKMSIHHSLGFKWHPFEGPRYIYCIYIYIHSLFFWVANYLTNQSTGSFPVLASFHEIFLGSVRRALHDVVLDGASKKHWLLEEDPAKIPNLSLPFVAIVKKLTSFKKTCIQIFNINNYGTWNHQRKKKLPYENRCQQSSKHVKHKWNVQKSHVIMLKPLNPPGFNRFQPRWLLSHISNASTQGADLEIFHVTSIHKNLTTSWIIETFQKGLEMLFPKEVV